MTTIVNIQEAKTQLSRLIHATLEGEKVIIANRGVPVVKMEKYKQPAKRELRFVVSVKTLTSSSRYDLEQYSFCCPGKEKYEFR